MSALKMMFTPKTDKALRFVVAPLVLVVVAALILMSFFNFEEAPAEAAVLKQGSTGETVRELQTRLKNWGYYTGSVDGIYGSLTVAAVKYFQRVNGLAVDGIVGEKTAAAVGIWIGEGSSTAGYSSSDEYLLARLVYAEARGEPYVGQVAVAAVVLNRVRSSSFPNTIAGVIYQPWAFSVVNDGQINLSPNQTAVNAARDAMNGWDPTYGCLYYYNPNTATNSWIKQKPIHLSIGNHVFCA